jgi:hypothetical protein
MSTGANYRWIRALFFLGFIVSVIWGGQTRLMIPAVPIPDGDTSGYLFPALNWLGGSGFVENEGREWFYPAFIAAVLKVSGNLGMVVRAQQLLGLAAIFVLFFAFYLHLHWSQPRSALALAASCILMLIPLYFLSLGTNELWIESALRPESICAFFFSFLFLGLTLSSLALSEGLGARSFILGGLLAISASYCLLLLKPSWGLAFPLSFCPYLALVFIRRVRLRTAWALAGGLTFVLLLQTVPVIFGFRRDRMSKDFLPFTLVSIHAKQISALSHSPGYRLDSQVDKTAAFLADVNSAVRRAESKNSWTILKFDGDLLLRKSSFFEEEQERLGISPEQFRDLCYRVYFQTWLSCPALMTEKIVNQLAAFTRDGQRFVCQNMDPAKAQALLRLGISMISPAPPCDDPLPKRIYNDWVDKLDHLGNIDFPSVRVIQLFSRMVGKVSLPLQLTVLLAWACSLFCGWRWFWGLIQRNVVGQHSAGIAFVGSVFVVSTLTTLVYGSALSVAISHSFDGGRYYVTLGVPLSVLTVRSQCFLFEFGNLIIHSIRR